MVITVISVIRGAMWLIPAWVALSPAACSARVSLGTGTNVNVLSLSIKSRVGCKNVVMAFSKFVPLLKGMLADIDMYTDIVY